MNKIEKKILTPRDWFNLSNLIKTNKKNFTEKELDSIFLDYQNGYINFYEMKDLISNKNICCNNTKNHHKIKLFTSIRIYCNICNKEINN